jgi:hypothetical protein
MTLISGLDGEIFDNNQLGHYRVGSKKFLNKYEALLDASSVKQPATYHWFDKVFGTFDRNLLGKRSLDLLYRERAQQLRDSYDYLILNYSGGCDSYNILRTFIDNGIKLDQIMVCWPFGAKKAGVYTPNDQDKRVENFMSEWDFATRPDLEWLATNHPEIKIELIDWAEPFVNSPGFVNENSFSNLNHFHNLADLARSTLFSSTEEKLISQGKKVATIWGIDKPGIFLSNNSEVYMSFADSIVTVAHPAPCNPKGTEYFYWTPDMPIIAYEMAYQTANWFKARPHHHANMWRDDVDPYTVNWDHYVLCMMVNQVAARDSCYTNWPRGKFQVNKPLNAVRADKDFWLYSHDEMSHHVTRWKDLYGGLLKNVDAEFCATPGGQKLGYRFLKSMPHYVCNI